MKHFYLTLTLLISTSLAFAQVPATYYDSANGLTGYALKTELRDITTSGHTPRSYGQLYDGVGISGSEGYIDTHSDVSVSSGQNYENDGTILDMYSENPTDNDSNPLNATPNNDPYNYTHGNMQCGSQMNEGDCYNREHLVPSSSWGGSSSVPMYTDIHHVIPTDGRVNNFRATLPFGKVVDPNPDFNSDNGSKRGPSDTVGYSGTMFEPIDEFKGDIARALLYFATRYQDNVDTYSFDMFNGTEDQVFENWAITTLLDWHYNVDPVDQRERDRNDEAYNFQNNANPFVDHPEYANMIWNPTPDTDAPSIPTNLVASNPTTSTIDLSWTTSTDNVGVTSYDVYDGINYINTGSNSTTYQVTGLTPETMYTFSVRARDAADNTSALSTSDSATTLAGSSSSNELYFSEYIEGSSFNKALEIANFTGATIDMSAYSVRRDGNGGGTWDTGVTLSGMLTTGNVFVIANASIDAACQGTTTINLSVGQSNSPTNFNGNDPIGLFKNGTLIDIIGVFGGGSGDFAANTTLVRNSNISQPNTAYNASNWTVFSSNTCSNLGQHSQNTLSINEVDLNDFKIYPNPVKGNILNIETTQNTRFEIYDILGKKILEGNVTSNYSQVSVSKLNRGIYILKLESENGSTSKKLIKE